MLNSVFMAVLGFILVPILLGSMSQEEYGLIVLTIFLSVKNGVLGIFEFGVQPALTKFVAEYTAKDQPGKIAGLLGIVFAFYTVLSSIIVSILLFLSSYLLSEIFNVSEQYLLSYQKVFFYIVASVFLQFYNVIFAGYFEGLHRFVTTKLVDVVCYIIYFTTALILLSTGHGFIEIIKAVLSIHVFTFIVYTILFLRASHGTKCLKWPAPEDRAILAKYCLALFSGRIASVLFNQSPKFFVTTFLSPAYLAIYDVVAKIPNLTKVIMGFGNSVVVPAASELSAKKDDQSNKTLFLVGLKLNLMFFVPFLLCIGLLSEELLRLWVGKSFVEYAYLMQTLLIVPFLSLFISHGSSIFLGLNYKVGIFSFFGWVIFSVSALYTLLLINNIELLAVTTGRFAGLSIVIPISVWMFLRYFKIPYRQFSLNILVLLTCAIVPYTASILLKQNFSCQSYMVLALWSAALYLPYVCLIYFLVLGIEEKAFVTKIVKRVLRRS